jgi:hypothetical protein
MGASMGRLRQEMVSLRPGCTDRRTYVKNNEMKMKDMDIDQCSASCE